MCAKAGRKQRHIAEDDGKYVNFEETIANM